MEAGVESGVAVVTGGTGALGRWVVLALLKAGLRVHVPWAEEEEVSHMLAFVGEDSGQLALRPADVTSPDEVDRFFGAVRRAEGRLDVLCNLVGGFEAGGIDAVEPGSFERMMRLNATSAFLCSQAALPLFRSAGGGRIVNVTALPALQGGKAEMSAYGAAKAAVLNLTGSLARELGPDRITVNALAPEILDTPANRRSMPDADRSTWVTPQEAAAVIAFLAGSAAGVVTGSVLVLRKG